MHTGGIQRVVAVRNAHKARTLFVSLRPQLGHLKQLRPVGKSAVGFPVIHDISGDHLTHAGNIFQKGCGSGIQVHAYFIHAVFHHAVQRLTQFLLVHIVLVLAHTDGFRIDLHKLRQRILQSSGDGSGASLSHVKVGEFFCGQLTRRVHRRTRLVDDHILYRRIKFFQQLHDHLLGFSGGRAVTDRDQGYIVFPDQSLKLCLGLRHLVLRCRGIDHFRVKHFTRLIHHRQLTAGTESRIPAKNHLAGDGRLQQKLL